MPLPLLTGTGRVLRGSAPFNGPQDIYGLAAWYDANDLGTLFQDDSFATPVTADGDVVGGWKDKSGNARHLTQGTAAAKPVYSAPATLIQPGLLNGGFETLGGGGADVFASWTEGTAGSSTITAVTGLSGTYGCRMDCDGSSSLVRVQQTVLAVGRTYRLSFWYKSDGGTWRFGDSTTYNDVAVASGGVWTYYEQTWTAGATTLSIGRASAASKYFIVDDVVLERIGGVVFDGSDDCLAVASFPQSGFTIFTVFSVVQTAGMLYEQSATASSNAGFFMYATTANVLQARNAGGTQSGYNGTANWACDGAVKQVTHSMNGTHSGHTQRINGTLQSLTGVGGSGDPGTTQITDTLNVGARNGGAALPLKGTISELDVYGSGALSAGNVALVEGYLRAKWRSP